ncbi:hypothetical protein O3M35_007086 [Rhynocoris fuscipes]|uniref:Uncharacterized protein n=1 Tax=Rhynocoris fuscipes TaxID=488301 RepID=A0AAW1DBP2_9HEMI
MRAFQRYPTTGSNFHYFRSYAPSKSLNLTYFLLIKIIVFCFFNLTYDMMTRQKFYN